MIKLICILTMLLFSILGQAQSTYDEVIISLIKNGDLSGLEEKIVRRDMKIQSSLLESILELKYNGADLSDIDSAASHLSDVLKETSKLQTIDVKDIVKDELNEVIETTFHPSRLKGQIKRISSFVKKDLFSKGRFTSVTLRKFGLQVGLYYLLAVQVDYTIPAILMAMGQFKMGAALFAIPFSSTTTAIFATIKGNLKYLNIFKTLGMKESIDHYNVFKKIKSLFNRSSFVDELLLDIRFNHIRSIVSIEQSNLMSKLLQKMGMNKNLNWENLYKHFIDTNYGEFVRRLDESEVPKNIKILRVLQSIEQNHDLEAMLTLKKEFAAKIQFIEKLPDIYKHKKWFLKLAHSKDMTQLMKVLNTIPKDLPPHVFDKAWRTFVLPNLAESFGDFFSTAHYKSFRRLFKNYDKSIYADLLNDKSLEFKQEQRLKFIDYIYEAFEPLNSCGEVYKKNGSNAPTFLR